MGHDGSDEPDRRQRILTGTATGAGVVLAFASLVAVVLLNGATVGQAIEIISPAPAPSLTATATPSQIWVHVSGEVVHPGVYTLPPGSRAQQAVTAAGRATAEAGLSAINLAAQLADGQQVRVPAVGEVFLPQRSVAEDLVGMVNIDTASAEELMRLPGVDEVIAMRILEYRQLQGPFAVVEQIMDVPGIGESKSEIMKNLITIGP